jgi:hypothetical protein
MKPLLVAVAVVLLAAALPASAPAGACSPLTCSPSQFAFAGGSLLGVRGSASAPLRVIDLSTGKTRWRLPGGVVTGNVVVHQDGTLLTWYDAARGTRLRDAVLQQHGTFVLVGTSQDSTQAVLARTQHSSTTFAIVSPRHERIVKLGGNTWAFDALNGDKLFLIRYLKPGYEIRVLHVASGVLDAAPLKDPRASATIWGGPWSRVSSADGRFVYTLYVAPNGASMIHVLDTRDGTARCIDLPGNGHWDAAIGYALVVDPDRRHLWAVSPGYGRVAHIDLVTHRVIDAYRFDAGAVNSSSALAAMSPDGETIAVTDAYHLWFVHLAARKVTPGVTHVAIALGWSPDQRHLWAVGERSRVSSLPTR